MKRLQFETCEERIVMAGDPMGALAGATSRIATFDFVEERMFVSSAATSDGTLLMAVRGNGASGSSNDLQLWTTDGTAEGTRQITTISTGGGWPVDSGMAFVGSEALFVIDVWEDLGPDFPDLTRAQLWKTDGTADATQFIAEIGAPYDFKADLHDVGSGVLIEFAGYIVGGGSRGGLWFSDATSGGTRQLGPTFDHGGNSPTNGVVELNGKVLFAAGITRPTRHDEYVDPGIYVASQDDTTVEPVRGFEIGVHELTVVNDLAFFWTNDGTTGHELWLTDGTHEGTRLVRDINPDPPRCNSCELELAPRFLTEVGGTLFFTAFTPEYGRELWKSDGTADGTEMVSDITPGPNSTPFDTFAFDVNNSPALGVGDLFFFVTSDSGVSQLWRSDGTASGTFSVGSFKLERRNTGGVSFAQLRRFTEVNGKLFFSVYDGTDTTQIWMSDGTPLGTQLAVSLENNAVSFDAWPAAMFALGESVVFLGSDKEEGHGIWSINLQERSPKSDINADGLVNFADFLVLSVNFGREVANGPLSGDLDNSGVVDFVDFLMLASEFNRSPK